MADQTAVYALYVSLGSLGVSIVSAIAAAASAIAAGYSARIAKQAALLERRTKAIALVRQATVITGNRIVADEDLNRLREAMNLSELAFGRKVQEALAQADSKARRLNGVPHNKRKEPEFQNTLDGLGKELQDLLEQMNREAALDR
jgi:hypothetical protein